MVSIRLALRILCGSDCANRSLGRIWPRQPGCATAVSNGVGNRSWLCPVNEQSRRPEL